MNGGYYWKSKKIVLLTCCRLAIPTMYYIVQHNVVKGSELSLWIS